MRINSISLNNPISFKKDIVIVKSDNKSLQPNQVTKFNEVDKKGNTVASGTTVKMTKYDNEGNVISTVEATRIDYFA